MIIREPEGDSDRDRDLIHCGDGRVGAGEMSRVNSMALPERAIDRIDEDQTVGQVAWALNVASSSVVTRPGCRSGPARSSPYAALPGPAKDKAY